MVLKFADDTSATQQHAGFKTKKEANTGRDEVVGQLRHGTYIVCGKSKAADFMEYWLEDVIRKRIADNTYNSYKNAVYNYISPEIGKMYMSTLNQGYIRKLYNSVTDKCESAARLVKTVMNTAMEYAKAKNVIAVNCAEGVMLPKKVKKKAYRILKIDVQKTLTVPQVAQLIEAGKETPIYMQIIFAVLMGLRRGEINGLKYSDVDYICCSTYGNPRSKSYHHKYFKELLKAQGLPDIHFHQLRNTYTTILLKNDFNIKGISNMLGHSKEIISAGIYGDTQEIIEDCLYAIEPFIEAVMPKSGKGEYYDYSDMEEIEILAKEYLIAA